MKKIISFLILLLAFSLQASAQTTAKVTPKTPEELAKQDVFVLSKTIDITGYDNFFVDLTNLFVKKHRALQEAKNDTEKKQIAELIDGKLKATFSPSQIDAIKAKPGLYEKLITN